MMTINYDLCTYTTDGGKTYCGLGRGSHLYADHFFLQGQPESDFNKVFTELEAPDYPATCDQCGAEGTNASMEEHICDESPASRAGERERVKQSPLPWALRSSGLIVGNINDNVRFVARLEHFDEEGWADGAHLIECVNQHATLIEQRERLVEALRGVRLMLRAELKSYQNEPWAQRVHEAYDATIEQEGEA